MKTENMKTSPNDPINYLPDGHYNSSMPGISIRQYFAAMAMQGLLANKWCTEEQGITSAVMAECAVKDADALIAELNKEQS